MEEIAASVDNSQAKRSIQKQINTAGNILTWDKLDLALSKVFSAVDEARQLNDGRLLKFTLCYIAKRVATRSEMDQYSAVSCISLLAGHCVSGPNRKRLVLRRSVYRTPHHYWLLSCRRLVKACQIFLISCVRSCTISVPTQFHTFGPLLRWESLLSSTKTSARVCVCVSDRVFLVAR